MDCSPPYTGENGWSCNERGETLSPLQAAPKVRAWQDDDILELRIFTQAEDVLFESQLSFFWESSESQG